MPININDKINCCGCASCVQICPKNCISFNEDKQGFRYPLVDTSMCIDCGMCERVCPILKEQSEVVPLIVYAAKNKNDDIREKSSSGGVFTLLAEKVLLEGGVAFGAKFDEKWEVVHDFTETINGLEALRGSKYLQSRIEDNFKKVRLFLKKGQKVLFSGTPCQIAGLRGFLQKEYDNLICIDFVCHGVPSPKVWSSYLNELVNKRHLTLQREIKESTIDSISFRDKKESWKKYSVKIRAIIGDDKFDLIKESFLDNLYMKAFLKNIILRPSCYKCMFKSGKSGSDITLGDFWGIDKVLSDFDDDKGVGLVMLNTKKGKSFFPIEKTFCQITTYNVAKKGNPSIYKSPKSHEMRDYFFYRFSKTRNVINLLERCVQYRPDLLYRINRKIGLIK